MSECNYIYKDMTRLETPCGEICVLDGEKRVPFSVRKNPYNTPYNIGVPGEFYGKILRAECNYEAVISTDLLCRGKEYKIFLSGGGLQYYVSDEGYTSLTAVRNNASVGISACDPNENEKFRQMLDYSASRGLFMPGELEPPPEYNERSFSRYAIRRSPDGTGFSFRLLDRSHGEITFRAAWIVNKNVPAHICEDAVSFWLI